MKTTYTVNDGKVFDTYVDATRYEALCLVHDILVDCGVTHSQTRDTILERASLLIIPLATFIDRALQPLRPCGL